MTTAELATRRPNGLAIDEQDMQILEISEGPAIMSPATRAEVDMQITTAKSYPRSIRAFNDQALAMATLDEDTAARCIYAVPRDGKTIEGPSIRLAEIVLSSWGNVRAESRVIDVGQKELTAEAMCWDLEKNTAIRVQVKRRITKRDGRRFSDDMIVIAGNAACSIALRNAVFKVIPMAFTKTIYEAARKVAIGDVKTLASRRSEMVAYFGKMGVQPDRVFAAVGKAGVEDITGEDLLTLKALATSIKDGETNIDAAFPDPKAEEPKGSRTDQLIGKLAPQVPQNTQSPGGNTPPPADPATETKGPGDAGNAPGDKMFDDTTQPTTVPPRRGRR